MPSTPRPGAGRPPAKESRAKDRAAARAAKTQAPVVDDGDWLLLPREGRRAKPPAWPLTKASARERVLWIRQWKRPQALAWERLGLDEQVAVYVRTLARAEESDSAIGLSNLVRMYQDGLGLSAAGMRMLRWKIASGHAGPVEVPVPASKSPSVSPKERLRLVSDGGG